MLDPDDEDGLRSRLYRIDAAAGTAPEAVGEEYRNGVEFAFIAVITDGQMYAGRSATGRAAADRQAQTSTEVVGSLEGLSLVRRAG